MTQADKLLKKTGAHTIIFQICDADGGDFYIGRAGNGEVKWNLTSETWLKEDVLLNSDPIYLHDIANALEYLNSEAE